MIRAAFLLFCLVHFHVQQASSAPSNNLVQNDEPGMPASTPDCTACNGDIEDIVRRIVLDEIAKVREDMKVIKATVEKNNVTSKSIQVIKATVEKNNELTSKSIQAINDDAALNHERFYFHQRNPKLCKMEQGWCNRPDGVDQNEGTVKLRNGEGTTQSERQQSCLSHCLAYKGATGCEYYEHGMAGFNCDAHTKEVGSGSGALYYYCWIFSKCTATAHVGMRLYPEYNALFVGFGFALHRASIHRLWNGRSLEACVEDVYKLHQGNKEINGLEYTQYGTCQYYNMSTGELDPSDGYLYYQFL